MEEQQDYLYWTFPQHIPRDFIEYFLKQNKNLESHPGYVGYGKPYLDPSVRKVDCQYPNEYDPMVMNLLAYGIKANIRCWNYEVYGNNQCDLLTYGADGGTYDSHVDTQTLAPGVVRKITVIAILNDEYEGGRFYFLLDSKNRQYIDTPAGTVIVFPSHIMHGVEPVTAGKRKSVVTWLVGPPLK